MNSIRVLFTQQEQQQLERGRYYIGVRVKIPTVIAVVEDEGIPSIGPSLDPQNSPQHSHPQVVQSHTWFVVFDLTDHLQCPTEYTGAAADSFLADHYPELDQALRHYLSHSGDDQADV